MIDLHLFGRKFDIANAALFGPTSVVALLQLTSLVQGTAKESVVGLYFVSILAVLVQLGCVIANLRIAKTMNVHGLFAIMATSGFLAANMINVAIKAYESGNVTAAWWCLPQILHSIYCCLRFGRYWGRAVIGDPRASAWNLDDMLVIGYNVAFEQFRRKIGWLYTLSHVIGVLLAVWALVVIMEDVSIAKPAAKYLLEFVGIVASITLIYWYKAKSQSGELYKRLVLHEGIIAGLTIALCFGAAWSVGEYHATHYSYGILKMCWASSMFAAGLNQVVVAFKSWLMKKKDV